LWLRFYFLPFDQEKFMSNAPQPNMFIQVPTQQRNFIWVPEPQHLREQIHKAETLANALWILAPAFIDSTAVERMGLYAIDKALETFRIAVRDFLCCELEQKLADQLANPLPTQEEMQAAMDQARLKIFAKPPVEVLINAQQKVAMLEEAIAKIEDLPDGNPIKEYGAAMMIPQYQMQLEEARHYLSQIQTAMEEPDADEDTKSPMSNGKEPGEEVVPDEAKP
jgi:hypothetical protein